MYSKARKMHLIKEVIKKASQAKGQPRLSAHDFVGLWSKEDAGSIEKAIEDGY